MARPDVPALSISPLRKAGQVRRDMRRVTVELAGLTAEVGLWHMDFPPRGPNGRRGSWSYFLCPACGAKAQILRAWRGRLTCWNCTGLRYPKHGGREHIERLRQRVTGPQTRRRKQLTRSLRLAIVRERERALGVK